MTRIFACILCAFCGGFLAAADAVLRLEVEQERVTAADLARVIPAWSAVPPETRVLHAPMPGAGRNVGPAEMRRLGERHGVSGAPAVRLHIERRMRDLDAQETAAALTAAMAERYGVDPADVKVDLVDFRAIRVPAGELSFRYSGVFPRPGEPAAVLLTWTTRERRSGTVCLRARLAVQGSYAVAARALGARHDLQPGDAAVRRGPLPGPPDQWRVTGADLAGKRLARSVSGGNAIPRAWLLTTPVVQPGDPVELRVRSGRIELRTAGEARQAGSVGDRIAVKNLASGKRVQARVVSPGQAAVEVVGVRP